MALGVCLITEKAELCQAWQHDACDGFDMRVGSPSCFSVSQHTMAAMCWRQSAGTVARALTVYERQRGDKSLQPPRGG
jgi:hypothetical protein